MISPISARTPSKLRQDLEKYCVEHGMSQTEAIAAGLALLIASPDPGTPVSPQDAVAGLAELERELAAKLVGFDPEAAEEEGRLSLAYVVDNAVVTGWWHAGQATDYTRALRAQISRARIHAPQLWALEFANVLRKLRVTGRLTDADVGAVAAQVNAARIVFEPQVESASELLERALRFDLSAYDAAYLGVAIRLRLPIACKDGALARAAEAAGVGLVQP